MRVPTTEEILVACPEIIKMNSIPLKNLGGHPRTGGGSRKVPYYNEQDRIKAASTYAVVGNANEVERITGIPSETVRYWRTQEWWDKVVERVQIEKDDEHDVKLTEIIDKILPQINDRVEKGDFIVDKYGKMHRKPMGGKELGVSLSIVADKRDLLRRKQKTNVETQSTKELLQNIANTVRDFVKNTQIKTIEGEVIHAQEANPVPASDKAQSR